jgi:hypothetical protein
MTSCYSKGFSGSPGHQASLISGSGEQMEICAYAQTSIMDQLLAPDFALRQGSFQIRLLMSSQGQLPFLIILS